MGGSEFNEHIMPEVKACPQCGAKLSDDGLSGKCPACLIGLAVGMAAVGTGALESSESQTRASRYFGDYELLEEIARGGMGIVFKARQGKLDRLVAVKMILAGEFASREQALRFRAEVEAAARLQHPNIVRIHETGEQDGQPYFSMDYVEGTNLAALVREKPLPAKRAAAYVKTIAEAIHYAHEQGILHRDLKPSNVLIDSNDQPRVTDFGLAKRMQKESFLTVTGDVMGSPNFMPPEQAGYRSSRREEARTRNIEDGNPKPEGDESLVTSAATKARAGRYSDVYGLGAILFYLVTGRPPFVAENVAETLHQVLNNEPVSPRLLNPSVPQDIATICLKCLEKEPPKRYQTAQQLADELNRFLNGEPVRARPVSYLEKTWRWCRRKPVVASLGTVTILLLLAVAVGSPIAAWRIDRERQRAEKGELAARQKAYASDMSLAQQSLKLNNLGRARRLLDRHRPQPGEEDLRGWEWRYLWRLTRSSALVTLTNRPVDGFAVSFSPDGTRLAVGWWDGRVDLWDVPGRRRVRALTDREYPRPALVDFAPVRNLLAATSEPKVVTLYDLDSGRESILWRVPDQGAWNIHDLAFSQDGSRLVVYAGSSREPGDEVWVVNVSSSQIESRHPTVYSWHVFFGAARLSPDNRRLYLARSDALHYRYNIQCLDLATGQELWQTERERDYGLTTLAISPDGRVLASGSGFEDSTIRVWDAATGRLLVRLHGHTGWVCRLAFTRDGRRLVSAATDQSIRFWDTSTWTETQVLRGHTDEIFAVAISEPAQLVASASKDGDLMLWEEDGKNATDGYSRLPENLRVNEVLPLDHSRLLLLPPGKPPELIDLKRDSPPGSLPEIGSSTDVLGWFGTNILCHWNGTNQILVRELRGAEFIQRGAITVDSGTRPTGVAYNATRQLLAWTEGTLSTSVYLVSLAAPGRRIELRGDVPGLVPSRFSEDGKYLTALTKGQATVGQATLRVWNVESGQIVAPIGERVYDATFASGGRVLVVAIAQGNDHEIRFYDLAHPDRPPQRVPGRDFSETLAVSPDGGLVASSTGAGQVRLFDSAKGELIESVHGHLNAAFGIAFSADGRRLISASGGREAVKLWDVGTRQELLTLGGTGSLLNAARWSADGDVILVGAPWQAWRAPSWAEIESAEKSIGRKELNSAKGP